MDWFCVKVLGDLAKKHPQDFFEHTDSWKSSKNLWQRRASVVGFVNHAKLGNEFFHGFPEDILNRCDLILESKERFIQTGSGWVIRELSKNDPILVYNYLDQNRVKFTSEGMRYASEKLPTEEKKNLRK